MTTTRPHRGEFEAFFRALWPGRRPFPWQARLAERVCAGHWPSPIAMPTSAGKTAAIDVALFALACRAPNAPRRIFFVVDRRIVVDEATERARHIRDQLKAARGCATILGRVADSLCELAQTDEPLVVSTMRGGILRDDAWCRQPAQPAVCCSTVDQVGSRLLFRGYGVRSPLSWPIHAGIVGNDALVIIDEAHCSMPFVQTAQQLARYREWAREKVGGSFIIVQMSATSGQPPALKDEPEDHADPVLGPRLTRDKWATLHIVAAPRDAQAALNALSTAMADAAGRFAQEHGCKVIGIIANRVAGARDIFEILRTKEGCDAVLLTGRSRAWDRDELWRKWRRWIAAGRERDPDRPVFVVATQCIEVGADIDFDALVTETASIDALRQRFGRLNRLGRDIATHAAVFVQEGQLKSADDPVYGKALADTWTFLESKAGEGSRINFGVAALNELLNDVNTKPLTKRSSSAPVMLPAHLDCWVQTSPEPLPSPEISVFLHGPETTSADVLLVWRADLRENDSDEWAERVAAISPAAAESMPLPWLIARRWLEGEQALVFSDVEGEKAGEEESEGPQKSVRLALRWRGEGDPETQPIKSDQIRPGDTLVVPASYGGADEFGWTGQIQRPVMDLAELVSLGCRGRAALRLDDVLFKSWEHNGESQARALGEIVGELKTTFDREEPAPERRRELLAELGQRTTLPEHLRKICEILRADTKPAAVWLRDAEIIAVVAGRRRIPEYPDLAESDATTSAEISSQIAGENVVLAAHLDNVAARARRYAAACGLPERLIAVIERAAHLHDIGKADLRFQALLHGGSVLAARRCELLAKSDTQFRDRQAQAAARRAAGYPRHARHEMQSVAMLEAAELPGFAEEEIDLLLHLVASHHGHGRPFAPFFDDSRPVQVRYERDGAQFEAASSHEFFRIGSGIADRFWRLTRQYGWHGLAWLESILRLADHRQSEEEQQR